MRGFKNIVIIFLTGMILFMPFFPVYAQSQDDVNPNFDPAGVELTENDLFVRFNYSCTNVPWPTDKEYATTYRYFPKDSSGVPTGGPPIDYYLTADQSSIDVELASDAERRRNFTEVPKPLIINNDSTGNEDRVLCPPVDERCNDNPGGCEPGDVTDYRFSAVYIPPALQQIENFALEFFYVAYAALGLVATFGILQIGARVLLGSFSPEQVGATLSKIGMWAVGFIFAILAPTILISIYQFLGISTTRCFRYVNEANEVVYDLTLPGFTFFFQDVCTGDFAVTNPDGS